MISSCTIKLLWRHCPHISAQLEVFQLEKSHLVFLDASAPFKSYVIICYISFMSVLTLYGFYDGQHEVAHEGETGKVSRANFRDRDGRTVLIMRPGKQNTTSAEGNIRHLVYLLENAILNLPEGQEQMSWLIDFTGFSVSTSLSIRTARDIINILQNHYPERLAVAFLYNPPRIFQAFWKAVKYFLDPKTSQKVKFVYPNNEDSVELMRSFFDVENLPKEFGGNATLEYDHEEFSRLMAEDDLKAAKVWGFGDKPCNLANGPVGDNVALKSLPNGYLKAEVAPEPF